MVQMITVKLEIYPKSYIIFISTVNCICKTVYIMYKQVEI